MKTLLLRFSLLLACLLAAAGVERVANAAGSSVRVGTAPNIASAGVEMVQNSMTVAGGLTTSTVKSVAYSFKPHRQCLVSPISGGCVSYMNVPVDVYICATSQLGIVYPESKRTVTDLRCTPKLTSLTGTTSAFNGMPISVASHQMRLYYLFTGLGSGPFSPHLEGQTDSVTVYW